jgi:hypothetical protein
MKKGVLLAVVAALMITPAAAMASHHRTGGKSAPKVMYVLHGKLSAYTPYDNSIYGPANGSITIDITHANHHGRALKTMTLTFPVGPTTKILLENGVSTIADGDRGIVKIRAAKRIALAHLAATLQAITARQIVDQGTSG